MRASIRLSSAKIGASYDPAAGRSRGRSDGSPGLSFRRSSIGFWVSTVLFLFVSAVLLGIWPAALSALRSPPLPARP